MGALDRFDRIRRMAADRVSRPGSDSAGGGSLATLADVAACYRLLLRREPDDGGLSHYRDRIEQGELTVDDLVAAFIGSEEFLHTHPNLAGGVEHQRVETVEGFTIYVDPRDWAVGGQIARTGAYEPEVTAALRSQLSPGATFVDVGANIGWYSLLAAGLVGGDGRVVGVEPNPDNCGLVERSAKENGFATITVVPAAASDSAALAALDVDASNGRIIPLDPSQPAGVIPCSFVVPIRPLDDLLADAGVAKVDVMKVDVEGAELQVLRGAEAMLRRDRPVIVSEFFPVALRSTGGCDPAEYLT